MPFFRVNNKNRKTQGSSCICIHSVISSSHPYKKNISHFNTRTHSKCTYIYNIAFIFQDMKKMYRCKVHKNKVKKVMLQQFPALIICPKPAL